MAQKYDHPGPDFAAILDAVDGLFTRTRIVCVVADGDGPGVTPGRVYEVLNKVGVWDEAGRRYVSSYQILDDQGAINTYPALMFDNAGQ